MTRHNKEAAQAYKIRTETIALHVEAGKTHPQIGELMGMTPSAVAMSETRRKRALKGTPVTAVSGRILEAERAEFIAMTERAKPAIKALRGESDERDGKDGSE